MTSKKLYYFLVAWTEWRLAGALDGKPFYRYFGLCESANVYGGVDIVEEISSLFDYIGYPFGEECFFRDDRNSTMHLCPRRIAWVEARIKEYENANL
jgi:hypothetical protein